MIVLSIVEDGKTHWLDLARVQSVKDFSSCGPWPETRVFVTVEPDAWPEPCRDKEEWWREPDFQMAVYCGKAAEIIADAWEACDGRPERRK